MEIHRLSKQQIYFGYANRHGSYRILKGQLLVRNLSSEIEGMPLSVRLAAGQHYVLPDAGWMMLTPFDDCEFSYQDGPVAAWPWLNCCRDWWRRRRLAP